MLKKALIAILALTPVLIGGILLGSIDAGSYDDLGLEDAIQNVPDEQIVNQSFSTAIRQSYDLT